MPIIKAKILRNIGDHMSIINREQLEAELLEVIDESLEESEKQYELDNKINVVDRGFLLQEKDVFYCALELDPGEVYAPPAAGVIHLLQELLFWLGKKAWSNHLKLISD